MPASTRPGGGGHRTALFDLTYGWNGTILLGSPAAAAWPDRAAGWQVGDSSGDTLEVVLVQPADNPSVIMIRWPDAPTNRTKPVQRGSRRSHEDLGVHQHPLRPIRAQRRY
jgi:hypothetical protein